MYARRRSAALELVPKDPTLPFTLIDVRAACFTYPWHHHPELELTLVVRGKGLRYVGDSIKEFEEGDLCLIGSYTPHCWLSEPVAGKPVRALVIQFAPEIFGANFLDLQVSRPIKELFSRAERGLSLTGELRTKVAALMEQIFRPRQSPLHRMAILLELFALLAPGDRCTTLSLGTSTRPQSPSHAATMRRILSYIHENAPHSISQRAAAELAGLSPAGFSRFFSRHFGKPFVTYVAEVRVGQACRLLLEDELGIADVALRAGFNNLANFNRRFRLLKGITPSEYRRMARSLPSSG
jgi:AraC-like DNA-binding protein/mannose-6-phosphate isomerase-like protein (cupin superfamily)